jgi:lipoate-protein ligase A
MRMEIDPRASLEAAVAGDEAALHLGEPCVRVSRLKERTLSLGVSQPATVPPALRAARAGLPVSRRLSGGVALLHEEGDVLWSIVLPRDSPLVGRDFVRAYPRLGEGVARALGSRGVRAEWLPAPLSFPTYCLFSGKGFVLSGSRGALGGASQHLTSKTLLHHGTLSTSLSPETLEALFDMPLSFVEQNLSCIAREGGGSSDGLLEDIAKSLSEAIGERERSPLGR